tara:strand:- start:524 stop:883 length:360 start_codon:yes stop_codon:yes gene_type:complete
MKIFITSIAMLLSIVASAQTKLTKVPQSGVAVVEFNAGWNSTTPSVGWLGNLTDCNKGQLLICENPKYQSKYKIVVVPTLVVFKDGEEVARFQADIMMKMLHTQKELQHAVDDAQMDGF